MISGMLMDLKYYNCAHVFNKIETENHFRYNKLNPIRSILILLILTFILIPQSLAADVIVSPSNKIVTQGQTFDLTIYLDPAGTPVAGAQLNIEYNKSIFKVNSIVEGNVFKQNGANTFFNGGTINNFTGKVENIFDTIIGTESISTGDIFIIINATAIGLSGTSGINLSNVKISDRDANEVPVNLINGSIKINGYSPTTPSPVISFTYPTPDNGATLTRNYALVNTTISSSSNTTAFIDWNGSLTGWWRFNGESGENSTFFRDWSSRGNNGTCSGSTCPLSSSGKFGQGLSFDGVNDHISAGSNVTLTAPYSIEGWVKIPANSGGARKDLISLSSAAGGFPIFSPDYAHTNRPLIYLNTSTYRYGSTNLADNKWHHIVFIVMGTNAADIFNAKIYVDGNEEVYGSTSSVRLPAAPSGKAWIGTNSFNGSLDEVRIQNRSLSSEEIRASYDAGVYRLNRTFTNLAVGVYNFRAFVQNPYGNLNQTELRTVTITSP